MQGQVRTFTHEHIYIALTGLDCPHIISYGMSARPDPVLALNDLKNTGIDKPFPRYAQIMEEAKKTMDFQKRKKLFEEAHGIIYQGVPIVMCYNYNICNAYWSYLKGFKIWSTNQARFWGVWFEK